MFKDPWALLTRGDVTRPRFLYPKKLSKVSKPPCSPNIVRFYYPSKQATQEYRQCKPWAIHKSLVSDFQMQYERTEKMPPFSPLDGSVLGQSLEGIPAGRWVILRKNLLAHLAAPVEEGQLPGIWNLPTLSVCRGRGRGLRREVLLR